MCITLCSDLSHDLEKECDFDTNCRNWALRVFTFLHELCFMACAAAADGGEWAYKLAKLQ